MLDFVAHPGRVFESSDSDFAPEACGGLERTLRQRGGNFHRNNFVTVSSQNRHCEAVQKMKPQPPMKRRIPNSDGALSLSDVTYA